jgi:hypothetical protein
MCLPQPALHLFHHHHGCRPIRKHACQSYRGIIVGAVAALFALFALDTSPLPSLSDHCRSASSLGVVDNKELFGSLWRAPLVWLMLNVLRFVLIVAFRCAP